jgi:hypothetical protein
VRAHRADVKSKETQNGSKGVGVESGFEGGKACRRLHRAKSAGDDTDEEVPARCGTIGREWQEEF